MWNRGRSSGMILALLTSSLLIGGASSCPKHETPKPPAPTPTPAPAGMPVLKVVSGQFVPPILGSVTTHHGWPLVDASALDAIAGSGLNYTAMRLPCELDDRPGYDMFVRVGDKADLTKFNPVFDALLIQTIGYAHDKGIYVNLGLWDGWCAVHVKELNSPVKASGNVNGIDIGTCADFHGAPHPIIQAQVNHVVSVIGRFTNVVWELGNEANRCGPDDAFIDGVRSLVRTAETVNHYPVHPWSPGTWEGGALGSSFDFVSQHGNLSAVAGAAVEVNEFSPQDRATYLANLAKYKSLGPYHYWHDDNPARGGAWDDPAWEAEWLDTMKKMVAVAPVTGCSDIPNDPNAFARPRWVLPKYTAQVNAAIQKVHPECAVGSECLFDGNVQAELAKITQALRDAGLCAAVQTDSEGLVDEMCVGTPGECQGLHVAPATGKIAWATDSRVCDPALGEKKCPRPYGPLRDTWFSK